MNIWSTTDFQYALEMLKISKNSKIFVHSSLGTLGIHKERNPSSAILNCLETLSEIGINLYLPAFTYSLSENRIFNPSSNSGLTQMGALSLEAYARNFNRTFDPIFSVLTNDSSFAKKEINRYNASFGENSLFSELVNENVLVLNLGTGVGTTLLHEVERKLGVPYRMDKQFVGRVLDFQGAVHHKFKWRSYVRDLNFEGSEADFAFLNQLTRTQNFVSRVKIGKTELNAYRIIDMAEFIEKNLMKFPNLLIRKGKLI